MSARFFVPRAALFAATALLGACASFSPDGGFAPVEQAAQERLGLQARWARTAEDQAQLDRRVAELLAQPLSANAAVQVALLNNRGLQARYQELGISEAEWAQATRPANPGLRIGRSQRGDEVEWDTGLHQNLARLIAAPWLKAAEARRFEQTQLQASAATLALAAEARKAQVQAVAAAELLRQARQVLQAADAATELARRMEAVGNFSRLQRAREQAFQADALLGVALAEADYGAARERLARLLGLWGEQLAFTLPERLPDVPLQLPEQPDIERTALATRLDLQAARQGAEQLAHQLGLTQATRFVNVLELDLGRSRSNQAPTQRSWEIGFELPLFDSGSARVARAEAVYRQALHRAAETAINARSEVRQAYASYRSAHEVARHHANEIVPLRKQIAEENLLRYNGMLIGVFELLADARLQIASVQAAIAAKRDFWLAQADLQMALVGPPQLPPLSGPAPQAAAGSDPH